MDIHPITQAEISKFLKSNSVIIVISLAQAEAVIGRQVNDLLNISLIFNNFFRNSGAMSNMCHSVQRRRSNLQT